jgi:ABC-type Fe3+/spermidine/putrescine transport system ATPase subunit
MNPISEDLPLRDTDEDSASPITNGPRRAGILGLLTRARRSNIDTDAAQPTRASEPGAQGQRIALGSEILLDRVSKHFAHKTVLDEISLKLDSGSFFALLGPSGSGKSTLLNLIAGFERPVSGDIRIRGRSVMGVPAYARQVGVVFQSYALFPHLNVAENLAYPLRRQGVRSRAIHARVNRMLELVRLGGYADMRITQLSGGQQQRVALARALVAEPDVLLMDEPMAALDKSLRDDLQVEIKQLQQSLGATIIYITHDQREALALADQIGVLNEGRFERVGDAVSIYARPASVFVARFLTGASVLKGNAVGSAAGGCYLEDENGVRLPGQWHECIPGSPGAEAELAINPAFVKIAAPGAHPMAWSIEARVAAALYVGESTIVHLTLQGGSTLVAREPGASGRSVGETVRVGWRPEDAFLFEVRHK